MKLKLLMDGQLQNEGKQEVLSCSRYVPCHLAAPFSLRKQDTLYNRLASSLADSSYMNFLVLNILVLLYQDLMKHKKMNTPKANTPRSIVKVTKI
jgi:hypothetical protein